MSDAARLIATASQTVGPFFHIALTPDASGRMVRPVGAPSAAAALGTTVAGEPMQLLIKVTDGDGRAVTDAAVELWHAGGLPPAAASPTDRQTPVLAFGRMATGDDGSCEFDTMRPARSPDATAATHAPHMNVCLFARGLLRQLYTRIYFAGDPALDTDPVLALTPEDRRRTLLATPDETRPGRWRFDLRLQGPDETVFFDG